MHEPRAVHLLDYWAILVRRRWVVYLAIVSACLIALVASSLITPMYRATASLYIERQNPDILTFRDLSRTDYSWAAYNDFYQTQYRILASEAVARRAVRRLDLTQHPRFEGQGRPGLLARLLRLLPRSAPNVEPDPVDTAARKVLASLEVRPVRNSQLVRVSWASPEPEFAARVANAVVDAYTEFSLESKFTTSDQATEFLVDQIAHLKREIATIEQELQSYGEAKRIVSIDDSTNITLQALSDVARRRTEAQTRLAQREAKHRSVRDADDAALPEVRDSGLIARLKEEYARQEAEYTEKSRLFKAGWPEMRTLHSRLEQARERLALETARIAAQVRASAEAQYREAANEVRNLDELLARQEQAAQSLKRDAVEFANLRSEVSKKRETLDALIARQNEMALSTRLKDLDATSSNIRIVDRARAPLAPFRPRTSMNVLLGLLLGLGFGVGLAFFLDYMDNTISSASQLETVTALPVLAVIPRHGAAAAPLARVRQRGPAPAQPVDLVAHRESRAGASEAYRGLRTALLLSSPGSSPQRIMVTSALPEEGKSATALNLAVVLAQLDRRVLLIDTDLRRPRLHRAFDLPNQTGVTTYLSGMASDAPPLVRPSGIERLDVLVSGPVPPNPSELLNSPVFGGLGERLLEHGYDHLIFDSPPVLSVADPVIVASVVDGVILVVRAEQAPRQSVRQAAEKLQQAGVKPIGVLLNDVRPDPHGYRGYYYYGPYGDTGAETPAASRSRSRSGGDLRR